MGHRKEVWQVGRGAGVCLMFGKYALSGCYALAVRVKMLSVHGGRCSAGRLDKRRRRAVAGYNK